MPLRLTDFQVKELKGNAGNRDFTSRLASAALPGILHTPLSASGQGIEVMTAALVRLVDSAILAPSGGNSQPWQFAVSGDGLTIDVGIDPQGDLSPMNAGQRMSRIAVGAAAENIYVAAQHNGWSVELTEHTNTKLRIQLARKGLAEQMGEVPKLLQRRVTNRRLYDGRTIAPSDLASLNHLLRQRTGSRLAWVGDRAQLAKVATVIGRADALLYGIQTVRQAFLRRVRLDRPAQECVDAGLSTGSLELGWGAGIKLQLWGAIPDSLYSLAGLSAGLQTRARNLVLSAGGICLLLSDNDDPQSDFQVGQLMQQIWLELTARDYAVQPMMSLPVLDNLRAHDPDGAGRIVDLRTAELTGKLQAAVDISSHERIAAVLRFGRGPAPSGRTGRRSAALVSNITGSGELERRSL